MSLKNPRINIAFEQETANVLNSLAKQERKTISLLAKELIIEALSRREDRVLSAIAESRDTQNAIMIDHDDAWK